ncbi:MAG: hypothetical protein K2P41_03415 [Lachnospiraceae bacterium]|nr:hypothetical protein [Lachnospiraceae bacterium]
MWKPFPIQFDFVPMMYPNEENRFFIAEKATFNSLTNFLWTEFYQGLARGNVPRCCHNCKRYSLLAKGYDTCNCNNIAPGETTRTCQKVGAHRKGMREKGNRTPVRVEYDWTYNRLKVRKQRKKISMAERNAAVAKAYGLMA